MNEHSKDLKKSMINRRKLLLDNAEVSNNTRYNIESIFRKPIPLPLEIRGDKSIRRTYTTQPDHIKVIFKQITETVYGIDDWFTDYYFDKNDNCSGYNSYKIESVHKITVDVYEFTGVLNFTKEDNPDNFVKDLEKELIKALKEMPQKDTYPITLDNVGITLHTIELTNTKTVWHNN